MKINSQSNGQANAELAATCLILEMGMELISMGRPGIRPKVVHHWLQARDDQPFLKVE
jgi:hypothetical protein